MYDSAMQNPVPDAGVATWGAPLGPVGSVSVRSPTPQRHVMVTAVSVALIICGALTVLISLTYVLNFFLSSFMVEFMGRAGITIMFGLGVLLGAATLVTGVAGLGAPAQPTRVPAVINLAVVVIVLSGLAPFVSSFINAGSLTHPIDASIVRSIVLQALLSLASSASGILLPVLLIVGARDLASSTAFQALPDQGVD